MSPVASPDLEMMQQQEVDPNATPLPEQNTTSQAPPAADEEEIDRLLLSLVDRCEKEDEQVRYKLIQKCKRNSYYFDNIQRFFWDEVARDYRTIDSAMAELQNLGPIDDIKTINIYRAYAESIIAALSVTTPKLIFLPEDAEDPDDIATAEAYTKICEIVEDHSSAQLMLIKSLTTLFNCGVVAAFNYYKSDASYGVIRTPKETRQKEVKTADLRCPKCGEMIDSGLPADINPQASQVTCNNCGYSGPPQVFPRLDYENEVVEYEETPKGRVGFDVFGPNYVKMPLYARKQEDMGYVNLRVEDHVAKFKTVYEDFADDIVPGGGDTYKYERWGRMPPEYFGVMPLDVCTCRYIWFRPWYFNTLEKEEAQKLLQQYPNGCMVTVINDTIVERRSEKLDEVWTISRDPRANYIHAEAQGNIVVPIQDAQNDLFNLGLQSIEYGIPETFVHPKTVNLSKYGKSPQTPGMMTPAMPPEPGKSLSDGFHTVKTATLSNEYIEFQKGLNEIGQFTSGAFPSIYGGSSAAGSKTASEYQQSRSQALQRLQITWEMISEFWAQLMSKCTRMFAVNLREDENYTKKQNQTHVNVWVRVSELKGKIGHVKPEINGQLPQSWAQKKDFVMQLMQMQDPSGTVLSILTNPNNSELMKEVTGMPDFYIPGENDRNKQFAEYYLLSQQQPVDDKTPSIMIDIDVDDHVMHMAVLKDILVSTKGMALYQTNALGYKNCIAHYRMHELAQQAKTISASGKTAAGQPAETNANSVHG